MGIFSQEYTVYACLHPDGDIYEVTELATCQGMLNSTVFQQLGADCCKVWLTFNPQTSHRDRQKQRQQERHTERQARHQQQGTNDSAGRKKGRKGRKRR